MHKLSLGNIRRLQPSLGARSIFPERVICTNHVRFLFHKNTFVSASSCINKLQKLPARKCMVVEHDSHSFGQYIN